MKSPELDLGSKLRGLTLPKKSHKNGPWSRIGSGTQMAPVILETEISMGEVLAPRCLFVF